MSQAGIRQLLSLVYAAGPVKKPKKRRTKAERTPKLPIGAELAYVAALRNLVKAIGEATRQTIGPVIAQAAAPDDTRTDAAGDIPIGIALDELRARIEDVLADAVVAGIVATALESTGRHNLGEMSRVLGIAPEALDPNLAETMGRWRAENVALIRSIGADYLAEVEQHVTTATTQGIRAEELAQILEARLGVASSRAELIAVDQVLKANSQLAEERMRRVGVVTYEWSTSRDERVREGHKALEGTVQRFDSPPIENPKTGSRANPGIPPRCRCVALPVFSDD